MADELTPDQQQQPLKTVPKEKVMTWFKSKVKEQAAAGDGPQLNLVHQLSEKYKRSPTDDEVLGAISELPVIKNKYRIEGFGAPAGQPQPPPKPDAGKKSETGQKPKSTWDKVFDTATTNVSGEGKGMRVMEHNANVERMKKAEAEGKPFTPTERYVAQTFEDIAGLSDAIMSPLGLVTAGFGPEIRVLAKAKDAGKIVKTLGWTDKFVRYGFSGSQALAAGKAALSWFSDPTPENAAKMIDSGALSVAVMAPEVKSGLDTIGRVPGAVKAGVEGYRRGSSGAPTSIQPQPPEAPWSEREAHAQKSYGKPYNQLSLTEKNRVDGVMGVPAPGSRNLPAGTPPKQIEAQGVPGLPEDFLRSAESETRLPRERIGVLNKLSTEDMLKRVDYYNQRLNQTPIPSRDMRTKLSDNDKKVSDVRQTLTSERRAVEMLLNQRGVKTFEKTAPGPAMRVRTPDTDLVPSGTSDAVQRGTSGPGVRTSQPQPPGALPAGQQRQIGQPQPPAGLLPEGESAYFQEHPQVYADARISRQEANSLAQKHGVSPNSLLKLSEHSNEDLVEHAKQMQTLRRAVINHPGDMMPQPEGTNGYPVHKQEFIDQLNRNLEALEDLLLHTKRGQAPASIQPQPPPATVNAQPQPPVQ